MDESHCWSWAETGSKVAGGPVIGQLEPGWWQRRLKRKYIKKKIRPEEWPGLSEQLDVGGSDDQPQGPDFKQSMGNERHQDHLTH